METWIRNQCSFNYRSQSFRLSLAVKSLFTGRKEIINETDQCLITEDGIKHQHLKEFPNNDEKEKPTRIWRRLSMNSFRKRKEKRQEEKSKPIIPAVLKTYDKRNKETEVAKEWL